MEQGRHTAVFSIRQRTPDSTPYFVGKDVAEILGYTNPTKAMQDHVDEEDLSFNESLKLSRQSGAWIINESGLYSLILSSKLPKAKELKRLYLREYRSKSDRQERTVEEHSKHDSGLCFVQSFLILINCTHNIFFLLLVSLWRF